MIPLRVFIGYDAREAVAYHVLAHSILTRASAAVSITPLVKSQLAGMYTRPRGPLESTDFSLTRFLVPYLSGFEGMSLFLDCDMLCLADIVDVTWDVTWASSNRNSAVWVCKHPEYTPRDDGSTKFLGAPQTRYPRKNWSSFMMFDNARCRRLTPDYVNGAEALDLHRFRWLDDYEIGSLPLTWNWLVGEPGYERHERHLRVLHYTRGGPWFPEYAQCDYAQEWFTEAKAAGLR